MVAGVMQMERSLMEFLLKNSMINPRIMVTIEFDEGRSMSGKDNPSNHTTVKVYQRRKPLVNGGIIRLY